VILRIANYILQFAFTLTWAVHILEVSYLVFVYIGDVVDSSEIAA
jgi:hypothetical protein